MAKLPTHQDQQWLNAQREQRAHNQYHALRRIANKEAAKKEQVPWAVIVYMVVLIIFLFIVAHDVWTRG